MHNNKKKKQYRITGTETVNLRNVVNTRCNRPQTGSILPLNRLESTISSLTNVGLLFGLPVHMPVVGCYSNSGPCTQIGSTNLCLIHTKTCCPWTDKPEIIIDVFLFTKLGTELTKMLTRQIYKIPCFSQTVHRTKKYVPAKRVLLAPP
jgi:hypothetical protein